MPRGLDDSKRLTRERREVLYERICARAQVAVAMAPPWRIDRDNILRASLWALARAVASLPVKPRLVFVDGRDRIDSACDCQAVIGGDGPPLLLIHGWPQTWYQWRLVMPALARNFTVVAVDLRGIGGSKAIDGGYDTVNLAADIRQLSDELRLDRPYIVGHDLGGQVAFAFVQHYPDAARGAMILDSPLPGIAGWQESLSGPSVWHVGFMQVPGLAEQLVDGRQAAFLGYFFQFAKFTPEEQRHYLAAYSSPAQLKAAFEIYRAFPANEDAGSAKRGPNPTPVVIATGEKSPFAGLAPKMVDDLKNQGFANAEAVSIPGAVHYVVEDAPKAVAELIATHAKRASVGANR